VLSYTTLINNPLKRIKMKQSAVEYLAEKLLENQTYDRDGYVIIDLSVEHLEYLVQRAKQIEERNLKTNI
jgi:hypothetical protein